MGKQKIDSRAIGLDVGLTFAKWLTGMENLHYGDWTDLDVSAGNAGRAQEAYTDRLFGYLPKGPCRILDIGGGAGETARKLIALGHKVEIVIPSEFLAERCRVNAPEARVHLMRFEDFQGADDFDVCLFSESFQYIPLDIGLPKALSLLRPGGRVVLADCFRSETFAGHAVRATVGGGHGIVDFRAALSGLDLTVIDEVDITEAVAPSVEIEQGLFNVVGHAIDRIDTELKAKRPKSRWMLDRVFRALTTPRKRERLRQRLMEQTRNREVFAKNNVYLMMALEPRR